MMLPRLVWFLVDGLPHELVRAYSNARPDSKLADMHAQQRTAPLTPLTPNCQTPPSLFTIWSGRGPQEHELLGYDVPVAVDGNPTAYVDGFQHWPRQTTMVWDTYANQGRTIRTCATPFIQAQRLAPYLLSATDVFRPPLADAMVLGDGETLTVGSLVLHVTANLREIVLRDEQGKERWRCASGRNEPEPPLQLPQRLPGDSHRALRLRCVCIDGQPKLISLGYHPVLVRGVQAQARIDVGHSAPYVVSNPGKLYARGELGLPMHRGGQGQAEQLLVSLMRDVHESFANDIREAVRVGDADLVVGYYPVLDLLSHQLLRYAVDACQELNGPLAGAFLEVMDWLDCLLAELAELIGTQARFVINSDHGMLPIEWDIHPNVLFAQSGWLLRTPDGSIDTQSSAAFFHPADNGLLVFHRERLNQLGLNPDDVIERLASVVAAAGHSNLKAIVGQAAPLGPAWQAQHYLQAPSRARLRAQIGDEVIKLSPKGGEHTVYGPEAWLRGTLIDAGMTRWLSASDGEYSLDQLVSLVTTVTAKSLNPKQIPHT